MSENTITEETVRVPPRLPIAKLSAPQYRAMYALEQAAKKGALDAGIEPKLLELIKTRVSQINGCAYCLDMHTIDARAMGESEQRLFTVSAWRETPFFTARERAALALAEAATRLPSGDVPNEVYDEAAGHFDETALAALIWAIATINTWNRLGVTARLTPGQYRAGQYE